MIRVAVAGAGGRTGRCVVGQALRDDRFEVVAALTAASDPRRGSTLSVDNTQVELEAELRVKTDVLIDFTMPEGTIAWLERCVDLRLPMVIGVTGYEQAQRDRIQTAARTIPIVMASNFSVGINLLLELVGRVAQALGPDYDVEIVEAHHRHKLDAPSGTALSLVEAVQSAKKAQGRTGNVVFGRHGRVGARSPGEIGVHAVRMGELVGWHEVHFSGPGETLTLRHAAYSRDAFAAGALRAAAWVLGKPPGLYGMRDVGSDARSIM
jgi:4-hydroxy-tetrahydrodipicolinate reductase